MHASALAREPATLDPVSQFSAEIANSHVPANAFERMLLTQVSQSWERLQRACKLEQRYFEKHDVVEVVDTKVHEFKAITRFVTDSERAWRHAVLNLEKALRRRQAETAPPKPTTPNASHPPAPEPIRQSPVSAVVAAVMPAQRE